MLLVPDCLSEAPACAQRGFLTACVNLKQDPDWLAGITVQGRIQHDVARVLTIPGVDRSRFILAGQGPSGTLAASLFPEFTHVFIGIANKPIFGVAHFADTLDILALAAPRPMLVNNARTRLTDPLRDFFGTTYPAPRIPSNPLLGMKICSVIEVKILPPARRNLPTGKRRKLLFARRRSENRHPAGRTAGLV